MEASDSFLQNPLLIAAILLFLVLLPRALRQKKSKLDRMLEQLEQEESKAAAKEEIPQQKAEKEIAPSKDIHPSPASDDPPVPEKKIPLIAPKKKIKKVVKEGIPISHNEEGTGAVQTPSKQIKAQQSSWDKDFKKKSIDRSDGPEEENNWIESEIPGLIIEPLPEDEPSPAFTKTSEVDDQEKADKGSTGILTIEATAKATQGFGVDEFEDFPTEKKLSDEIKKPEAKAGVNEVKKAESKKPAAKGGKASGKSRKTSKLKSKDVEIKEIVVSHKDIAENRVKEEADTAPFPKDPEKARPLAESEKPPLSGKAGEPEAGKGNSKPFFLDLKYLVEEGPGAGSGSGPKWTPELADRIVSRLNELQVHLENRFASLAAKPVADRDIRPSASEWGDSGVDPEGGTEREPVSLETVDAFLFPANRRKK